MRVKTARQEGNHSVATVQASPVSVVDRPRSAAALLLDFQHAQGNRFVQRLLNGAVVQHKSAGDTFDINRRFESPRQEQNAVQQVRQRKDSGQLLTLNLPTAPSAIQLQQGDPTALGESPVPCDDAHARDVDTALTTARTWRRQVSAWFDNHLNNLRSQRPRGTGAFRAIGSLVSRELGLLDRHFRISEIIRDRGSIFPQSADERAQVSDLENFAGASFWIRRHFQDVDLSGIIFQCQPVAPRRQVGGRVRELWGSAAAGSGEVTIYTTPFDQLHVDSKAAVVLHEAFHATWPEFNHDSYSFEGGSYPGSSPLTNADSYATFASIVATGSTYRIVRGPEIRITGSPSP